MYIVYAFLYIFCIVLFLMILVFNSDKNWKEGTK